MRVILATDGTKFGDAAVKMVERLALGDGDSVLVLSVVDMALPIPIDLYGGYLPDTGELEAAARENAAGIVNSAKSGIDRIFEGRGVSVTTDIQFGSPESRVVETAEEIAADLIVIGSHGYRQWERLLLGSVSSSVVNHAPCSVLVVRAPEAE